ncbi:MAG: phosphate signaling complex protein PhoU [Acidimicrobiales bacterium]
MPEPTRTAFDRELADLDADVACLAAQVGEALGAAAEALVTGDHGVATKVVDDHAAVDGEIRRCEARAFEVLARQQPAAGDLRFLVTVVRLTHELERSGKLVRHVASFASRPRAPLPSRLAGLLGRMAEEAHQLFQGAVEAYGRRDVASAEALDVWDDRLDELHRRFLAELFRTPPDLATTIDVVLVGRYLERVADHAVTIGHRIRYLVMGEL